MPAVKVFGRRTLSGGDDLQMGAIATIGVRCFQLTFLALPLLVHVIHSIREYGWYEYFWGSSDGNCPDVPILHFTWVLASMTLSTISLGTECLLYHTSGLGTPTDARLREPLVPRLLEWKLVPMSLANMMVFTIGMSAAVSMRRYYVCRKNADINDGDGYVHEDDWFVVDEEDYEEGDSGGGGVGYDNDGQQHNIQFYGFTTPPLWWVCFLLLLTSQAAELVVSTFSVCRVFNIKKDAERGDNDVLTSRRRVNNNTAEQRETTLGEYMLNLHHHAHYGPIEDMWERRCRMCCKFSSLVTCYLFGGRDMDSGANFSQVAKVLADYFEHGGELDLVPSDIAAAFMMLRQVQKQRVVEARRLVLERVQEGPRRSMVMDRGMESGGGSVRRSSSQPFLMDGTTTVAPTTAAAVAGGGGGGTGGSTTSSAGSSNNNNNEVMSSKSLLRGRWDYSPSPNKDSPPRNSSCTDIPTLGAGGGGSGSVLVVGGDIPTEALMVGGESSRIVAGGGGGRNNLPHSHSFPIATTTSARSLAPPQAATAPTAAVPNTTYKARSSEQSLMNDFRDDEGIRSASILAQRPLPSVMMSSTSPDTQFLYRLNQSGSRYWYDCINRTILSRDDDMDRNFIAEGTRFVRHTIAIYTWMLYVYMRPTTGLCQLTCCKSRCCCCWKERRRQWCKFDTFAGRGSGGEGDVGPGAPPATSSSRGGTSGGTNHMNKSSRRESTESLVDETCYLSPSVGEGADISEGGHKGPLHRAERCIEGDNCWNLHETALLKHAGLDQSDLVYARFDNGFTETPYCIIVDRKWQSVVVAIRGSLSLEDCVVDVLVDAEHLEDLGNRCGFQGQGEYCHSGILSRVEWIHEDLQRHGLLDRLLHGSNAELPGYSLRIVGHSLGAGCAIMLSYMLRSKYPGLRCLCYSPPGGLLSWPMATGCKDFVTSFVLDSELVPRLSIESMEHLRNEVLELILRIKVPKAKVVRDFVMPGFCSKEEDSLYTFNPDDLLYPREAIPGDNAFARQLEAFKALQRDRKQVRGGANVKLYPPGKIIHLVKTSEVRSCGHGVVVCLTCGTSNIGSKYTPVWANNDDFNEVIISPTMGTDHFPNRVCIELENVAREFGIDTTLGSSPDDGNQLHPIIGVES